MERLRFGDELSAFLIQLHDTIHVSLDATVGAVSLDGFHMFTNKRDIQHIIPPDYDEERRRHFHSKIVTGVNTSEEMTATRKS